MLYIECRKASTNVGDWLMYFILEDYVKSLGVGFADIAPYENSFVLSAEDKVISYGYGEMKGIRSWLKNANSLLVSYYTSFENGWEDAIPKKQKIGCMDTFSVEAGKKKGFAAYFSGDLLTIAGENHPLVLLENRKNTALIGLQDYECPKLPPNAAEVIRLNYKVFDNELEWKKLSLTTRKYIAKYAVEMYLTAYREAKLVITNKLHALIPCLIFGTPVVLLLPKGDSSRYSDYAHYAYTMQEAYEAGFNLQPKVLPEVFSAAGQKLRDTIKKFVNP